MSNPFKTGAGGTSGGLGTFLLGLVMTLIGGYLLLTTVQVTTGFWGFRFLGGAVSPFGLTMIFFLLGVVLVFFDVDSKPGRALVAASLLLMLVGIIANLQVYFRNTSLFVLLGILILLFGGIGLMARALKAQ